MDFLRGKISQGIFSAVLYAKYWYSYILYSTPFCIEETRKLLHLSVNYLNLFENELFPEAWIQIFGCNGATAYGGEGEKGVSIYAEKGRSLLLLQRQHLKC